MSKWKRTVKQLFKEFWLPLVVAISWAVYNGLGQTFLVKDFITNLMPAFFLASWMTGQIFRVRKQAGMEASIDHLQLRLGRMIDELNDKTRWTINHITGGDGYCLALPKSNGKTQYKMDWEVINCGDFSMYETTVTIDDLDMKFRRPGFEAPGMFTLTARLGEIPTGASRMFEFGSVGHEKSRSFTVIIDSRNGRVIQDVRFIRNAGSTDLAYRVTRDGEVLVVLEEYIPEHFPLGEDGKFDWSVPELNENDG
ncbi:hypothetical protein [Pseudomonas zeae]|uniref:hypothetical protein n=1 Tax=Pseudomonas zeae TaxID=2745510 RepID=UPI003D069BAA